MPWAIQPWLVLVESLRLAAKEQDKYNNDVNKATLTMTETTATELAAMPTARMSATMATRTKVTLMAMAVAATTTTLRWDNGDGKKRGTISGDGRIETGQGGSD
jgi:hypothetical protein